MRCLARALRKALLPPPRYVEVDVKSDARAKYRCVNSYICVKMTTVVKSAVAMRRAKIDGWPEIYTTAFIDHVVRQSPRGPAPPAFEVDRFSAASKSKLRSLATMGSDAAHTRFPTWSIWLQPARCE